MQRQNFQRRSGVVIDRCGDHGHFLDGDELEAVVGYMLDNAGQDYSYEGVGEGATSAKAAFARVTAENISRRQHEDHGPSLLGVLAKLLT